MVYNNVLCNVSRIRRKVYKENIKLARDLSHRRENKIYIESIQEYTY